MSALRGSRMQQRVGSSAKVPLQWRSAAVCAPCARRGARRNSSSNSGSSGAACAAARVAGAPAAVAELLDAIKATTDRGVKTPPGAKERIMAAVKELKRLGVQQRTVDEASATWKLLWTTEKESLWIIENAGLFGTKAGGVFQVIDTAAGTLQNVIEFPPEGSFIVDSAIQVEGPRRINFQFTAAKLKLPRRELKLPPFGKGWFDTVYVDERIRVAQDIRGDTLVVERDGPPRKFT